MESEKKKMPIKPDQEETLIVAISGGPDSMALADQLYQAGYHLVLAHVNYHKRESAGRDEQIVRNYAKSHNIPFEKLDAPEFSNGNFQDWARELRYSFFEKLAKKYGTEWIVVGHHQDDLLETYLIQKERKAIPQIYGLPFLRPWKEYLLWRPLLSFSKKELEAYCRENEIAYGIDESNLSDAYLRNRIRHSRVESMSLQERKELLEEIKMENDALSRQRKNFEKLLRGKWVEREEAASVFGEVLSILLNRRFSQRALEEFIRVLREKGEVFVGNVQFVWSRKEEQDQLLAIEQKDWSPVFLQTPEDAYPETLGHFSLQRKTEGEKIENVRIFGEDYPLNWRPVKAGDTIAMRFGTKKLSRFFIDRKIPAALRSVWPVLVNRKGEVIFVPGLGADKNHFHMEEGIFLELMPSTIEKIQEKYNLSTILQNK